MNGMLRALPAVVSIVLSLGWAVPLQPAAAASRCDSPTVGGESRACAARLEGTTVLRGFIERTQRIPRQLWRVRRAGNPSNSTRSYTAV